MKKIKHPEIIIITGLSGAGKSIAIKSVEDFGGFCIDNMPYVLIAKFINLLKTSDYVKSLIALGLDVRSQGFMKSMEEVHMQTKKLGFSYKTVFLEASDSVIIRRYNESRRIHPLMKENEKLEDAVERERQILAPLRETANVVIDTSSLSPHELKQRLKNIFFQDAEKAININIMSFGFKYGIPEGIDMLIDTRFLPNPHYVPMLSPYDGHDDGVKEFVMKSNTTRELIERYDDLLNFLIPNYISEGKSYLNVAVGCTGGKHRSVVVSNELCERLKDKYNVFTHHRDNKRL
jgi:UPF0042 nucleotide-binding protein